MYNFNNYLCLVVYFRSLVPKWINSPFVRFYCFTITSIQLGKLVLEYWRRSISTVKRIIHSQIILELLRWWYFYGRLIITVFCSVLSTVLDSISIFIHIFLLLLRTYYLIHFSLNIDFFFICFIIILLVLEKIIINSFIWKDRLTNKSLYLLMSFYCLIQSLNSTVFFILLFFWLMREAIGEQNDVRFPINGQYIFLICKPLLPEKLLIDIIDILMKATE